MTAEPEGAVLLEQRVADDEDVYARRVTEAGEVWRLTSVHARIDGGEMEFRHSEPAWERLGVLPADVLAALREAVADPELRSLPETVEPDVAVLGGSDQTWIIAGRTIEVRGAPVAVTPALARLAEELDGAVSTAQDVGR